MWAQVKKRPVGAKSWPRWSKQQLEPTFEIKKDLLGRDDQELKTSGKIQNRHIKLDKDGWKLEADPRHAELLIEPLGVGEGKGLTIQAYMRRRVKRMRSCWISNGQQDIDH